MRSLNEIFSDEEYIDSVKLACQEFNPQKVCLIDTDSINWSLPIKLDLDIR